MTICNRLKDIIHDAAQISLEDPEYNNTSGSLIIKEPDENATCKQVTLTGLSADNTFACKLDCKKIRCGNRGHTLSPYFKDGKDLDKGCDALIITKIQFQWYLFFVELKSTLKSPVMREAVKQFKSSTCFVQYIQAILRISYKQHDINNIKPRYIIFYEQEAGLRTTKGKPCTSAKISKSIEKIDGKPIKHLKGKKHKIKTLIR